MTDFNIVRKGDWVRWYKYRDSEILLVENDSELFLSIINKFGMRHFRSSSENKMLKIKTAYDIENGLINGEKKYQFINPIVI